MTDNEIKGAADSAKLFLENQTGGLTYKHKHLRQLARNFAADVVRLAALLALQPCGHPAAAIRHGSGNPTTNYCGWCADIDGALDAGRKETRRVVVPVWSQRVAGEPDWRCSCGWRIGAFGRQVKYCPGCGAWLRWPKV